MLEEAILICRERQLTRKEVVAFLVERTGVSVLAAENYYDNNKPENSNEIQQA